MSADRDWVVEYKHTLYGPFPDIDTAAAYAGFILRGGGELPVSVRPLYQPRPGWDTL